MKNRKTFEGTPDPQEKYYPLAQWLQQVLAVSPLQSQLEPTSVSDETQNGSTYHRRFYKQLPDFVMALLNNDQQATLHYAPLLFHLIGCPSCHTTYLEFYDAMRAAMQEGEVPRQTTTSLSTLATTPERMVVHLCQSLISEAEAVLRQARREHTNGDALARTLLQQAIRISAHLTQGQMRQRARRELVRVATLFEDFSASQEQPPALHSYSPMPVTGNGVHRGSVVRGADTALRPAEQATIPLHSAQLEGAITQHEDTLELHLRDLDVKLRGHYVIISVPLGSLLEPVRWLGGNPRVIRSVVPVDEHGMLRTPLGQTELRLSNLEERNLLEAMFLKLDVRLADYSG
jgi:hypothetical protein